MLHFKNVRLLLLLCNVYPHPRAFLFLLGYMHEHGLGVPRDYDLAWSYYDRARRGSIADVDQRLDGMPIELLIALARFRYVFRLLQLLPRRSSLAG